MGRAAGWTLLAGLAAPQLTCHQAILTAPPGSSLSIFANPTFIAANGDVSVISVLILEPAGTPVPDGTVIQFFTTLGQIPEQGKTNDGVARVNLVSDTRSGTATVTAISGGEAPAPAPSASPTTGAVAAVQASAASGSVDVVIGSARPATVIVVANPPRVTGEGPARQSRISANVLDENGNPVIHAPVIFTVSREGDATEYMVSGGAPIFTDTNGQAIDFLRTRYSQEDPPKVVTVTATTANGIQGSVEVQIN
jgi:hypothetical protein